MLRRLPLCNVREIGRMRHAVKDGHGQALPRPDKHGHFETHVTDFITAYHPTSRFKNMRGLATPMRCIRKAWAISANASPPTRTTSHRD